MGSGAADAKGEGGEKRVVRPDKVELVQKVTANLREAQSVVVTDFQGLTVAQISALRAQLRTQSVSLKVIKNRLLRRALAEAGCDSLDDLLVGNTAVAFATAEPAAPAKLLLDFAKTNEKLRIKGGLLEGRRLDMAGVQSLSKLPGRRELLAQLAGDFKQPAAKMAQVMQAGLLKVAYAMKALGDKKGGAGEAAA